MIAPWYRLKYIIPFFICFIVLLPGACSKSNRGIDGIDENLDNTAPAPITDLRVTEMTPNSVSLQWSATGDDLDSGTATAYDLRYLPAMITIDNWDSAVAVTEITTPGAPHTLDSVKVTDLQNDSTYYFAIKARDEAGNRSGLSNIVSAVCLENVIVAFADTVLERIVRSYIGKPSGSIYQLDMLDLWQINAWNQHLHDLGGIEYGRNLNALRLWNNNVTNLTPLAGLDKLRVLNIGYNGLSDIAPLASLVGLDTLQLNSNDIQDLSALADMNNLTDLELTYNAIWNLSPLTGKTTIRNLALDGNQIVFINALYNLTGLERLSLSNNQINDLLPLAYNTGLGAGDSIWLLNNPLSASSTDSLIAVLRDRGVIVLVGQEPAAAGPSAK